MYTRLWAFVLSLVMALSVFSPALAASRGPASTIEELQELLASAHEGDVILIDGDIACENSAPLTSAVSVHISSSGKPVSALRSLRLQDASISFSDILITDTLQISGTSHVHLHSGVRVVGADGQSGVSFSGNGVLIADRGSAITGGSGSAGVSIRHSGGEFYASFEGSVAGGSGHSGGPGIVVSPLGSASAMMIAGSVRGGDGTAIGGHALNLYDLHGNAFVTIDGDLHGGSGSIGGDGVQLVSVTDSVNVGIMGRVKGGSGDAYGGDAIMLMDADGVSSIHLSGEFSGGDAVGSSAQPGTALIMVGDVTAMRARVNDCLLEDGSRIADSVSPIAQVTPLPSIQPSADDVAVLDTSGTVGKPDSAPSSEAPETSASTPALTPSPEPTAEPVIPDSEATPGEAV